MQPINRCALRRSAVLVSLIHCCCCIFYIYDIRVSYLFTAKSLPINMDAHRYNNDLNHEPRRFCLSKQASFSARLHRNFVFTKNRFCCFHLHRKHEICINRVLFFLLLSNRKNIHITSNYHVVVLLLVSCEGCST